MNKYLIDPHLVGLTIFQLARGNLAVNNKDNKVLCLGTIDLIVSLSKFMFLKLAYLPSKRNICFKNIKFLRDNYQPIFPRQKHSIV